jgi:hypothetical protein
MAIRLDRFVWGRAHAHFHAARLKSQQVSPGKGTPQNARVRPLRQPTTHQCCDGGRCEISVRRVDCHAVDREGSMSEPSSPVPLEAIAVQVRTYSSPTQKIADAATIIDAEGDIPQRKGSGGVVSQVVYRIP